MQPVLLIPLVVFGLLAALFALVLRRAGQMLSRTRDAETFRRSMVELGRKIDASMALVIEAIDGVRRRRMGAEAIADHLSSALEAMKGYDSEVRGLRPPASAAGARDRVVAELERAARALEMVEHGCAILMSARIGGRELEAQTAIKRGYLNLLHAREAILQAGTEAVAFRPEEENRWLAGRRA